MKLTTLNDWLTLTANVGVLVGILFLSLEIRQSNRIAVNASAAEFRTQAQDINRSVFELAGDDQFIGKLLNLDAQLTDVELARATMFARSFLNLWAYADASYKNGLVDDLVYQASIADIDIIFDEFPGALPSFSYLAEAYDVRELAQDSEIWRELIDQLEARGY